jgi:hypothetical protein
MTPDATPVSDPVSKPSPNADNSLPKRLQRRWQTMRSPNSNVKSFLELYHDETCHLDQTPDAAPDDRVRELKGPAGEPSIRFTPHDRFGLALSGGGIRSATFNLGVLQSLSRLGILSHVDYLSTVSGGGYIGGFWTAWLQRNQKRTGHFPSGFDRRSGERSEIRHLREFSRFLLPRMGFFETEFWAIVMTMLGGMVPSLLTAAAVLGITWYLWVIGLVVLTLPGIEGALLSTLALLLYLSAVEIGWHRAGRAEHIRAETLAYAVAAVVAGALFFGLIRWHALPIPNLTDWGSLTEVKYVTALPLLLGLCTLLLLLIRMVAARFLRDPGALPCLTGVERCAMRVLGLTAGMSVLAGLWLLAIYLGEQGIKIKMTTAGTTGVLALIFAWAKKWLTEPVQQTHGGTLLDFAVNWLKRATPKILSNLVWLLSFVLIGSLLHWWGSAKVDMLMAPFWLPLGGCAIFIGLVTWLFDPARVGMHEFYRSRISRCYLGASNGTSKGRENERAALNRHVAERPGDDIKLKDLRDIQRPIHLVCVAANDMSGDQLGNLYRGARSAVLSGNGISLGDKTARLDELRLSSALTASAAAFNSQMGRVSMNLGRSVGFLMSALNLRLGLWVPHPDNPFRASYTFPGRFFLAELFGISRTNKGNLHLSDGNHFENFGLYELVRRHCRYIIVSDCGADREVAFDDLANVLRRVREDFGVEIELDVSPLRPDENRRACQHAVVGTIHYDGMAGMDKGTILYFKPGLTGDEPPDVLQYSTRNVEFPHEGTADQFYDEAQWESYRRLGEHAIDAALGFFENPPGATRNPAERLFRDARSRWHAAPAGLQESFLEMSERCATLEQELMADGPEQLRAEFFAEAAALVPPAADGKKPSAPDGTAELCILSFLVRIAQIMEDTWVSAQLDIYWSHPLNEGWMNYFQRWAATASFRRWWPVIAPLYALGVREFVCKRFDVGVIDPDSPRAATAAKNLAQLHLHEVKDPAGFFAQSFVAQQYLKTHALPDLKPFRVLAYELQLLDYTGALSPQTLPIGFVLANEHLADTKKPAGPWMASWQIQHLYVPDSLSGSGFLSKFLDAVLRFYEKSDAVMGKQFAGVSVQIGSETAGTKPKRPNRAEREERVRDIEFYKSRAFTYVGAENTESGSLTLQRLWSTSADRVK